MTKNNYIRVLPPFPKITGVMNTCDGNRDMVSFSQDSKKASTWTWSFGDGSIRTFNVDSPAISHRYAYTGSYKVVLFATSGQCSVRDSTVVQMLLKQNPLLTASASGVCASGQIQVTINNLQNNPWPNNNNSFYYLYKTEYNDLSFYKGIINSENQNYEWGNTFSGSFTLFEKDKTGVRAILRSVGFDCADTTNFIPLSIKGSTAGFEIIADDVCFKSPVILKDTSKTNSKTVSWNWDFGDGTMQRLDHGCTTSHGYANPGAY